MRIPLLPKWIISDTAPCFYDTEKVTTLESIAKLHGATNALIEDYNKFVDEMNAKITEFTGTTEEELTTFETALRQEFQDFIDTQAIKYSDIYGKVETLENSINGVKSDSENAKSVSEYAQSMAESAFTSVSELTAQVNDQGLEIEELKNNSGGSGKLYLHHVIFEGEEWYYGEEKVRASFSFIAKTPDKIVENFTSWSVLLDYLPDTFSMSGSIYRTTATEDKELSVTHGTITDYGENPGSISGYVLLVNAGASDQGKVTINMTDPNTCYEYVKEIM